MSEEMGARLTEIFQEIKRYELDRWDADWRR